MPETLACNPHIHSKTNKRIFTLIPPQPHLDRGVYGGVRGQRSTQARADPWRWRVAAWEQVESRAAGSTLPHSRISKSIKFFPARVLGRAPDSTWIIGSHLPLDLSIISPHFGFSSGSNEAINCLVETPMEGVGRGMKGV